MQFFTSNSVFWRGRRRRKLTSFTSSFGESICMIVNNSNKIIHHAEYLWMRFGDSVPCNPYYRNQMHKYNGVAVANRIRMEIDYHLQNDRLSLLVVVGVCVGGCDFQT